MKHDVGVASGLATLIPFKVCRIKYLGTPLLLCSVSIRNSDLHRDLILETVLEIIKGMAQNHEQKLHNHRGDPAV